MFADFRVHGLKKMGEARPFSFPASSRRPVVKALEKARIQPMYAKVREGHPSRGQGLVASWESGGRNDSAGLLS
jgi:hypothetical protein